MTAPAPSHPWRERRETAKPAVRCIYCNAPLNRREHETGDACGECATPGAGLPVADLGALLGLGRTLRAELL